MACTFLGMPDVSMQVFSLLSVMSFLSAIVAITLGAGGGLLLLVVMAYFFPPSLLVPMHTVVQLGIIGGRTLMMYRNILRPCLVPFAAGSALGAVAGGQLFINLPAAFLQGLIGVMIIGIIWGPRYGRFGPLRWRFTVLGFLATFVGMFVSVTAVLVGPFVSSTTEDRRQHVATLAGLATLAHVLKIVMFGVLGLSVTAFAPLMLSMVLCGIAGNYLGMLFLQRIQEKRFRQMFKIFMTLLALRLVVLAWLEIHGGL